MIPLMDVGNDASEAPNIRVPCVTWLLCTHVANEQLQLALRSCLLQSFVDFELIVVTNGPAANEVAAQVLSWFGTDARVRVFSTAVKQLTFSLALGLHHARADLIARMDGDDISTHDRLERQVRFMQEHSEIVVLGSSYELIDSSGAVGPKVAMPLSDAAIRRAMFWGNPFCHPSVMFRRNQVINAGGYLGSIYAQDYDLWVRLAMITGLQFANTEEAYLRYRMNGVGTARKSRFAYAAIAAVQFRSFVLGGGFGWFLAALLSFAKAVFRGT
jgi:glycosyltransferase involved in cell wall biosynthesis